ncbi:hypothetical protein N865_19005 [Intrasporangium oryzae NRRL B-24470]|uniref:Lipoprotein n=1 Tax=Intrasporangium oryzae NRRL B-24470 TaxID=1386089 RepID=W9GAT6_9MICO|nr:hypothetical protein [Intrasporangium oryzae]EWT03311.1 hypothetical protein N865_19005 [Intrasporangium oryzae NRRL B-24470]
MRPIRVLAPATAAVGLALFAACGSSSGSGYGSAATPAALNTAASSAAANASGEVTGLTTSTTALGTFVTDNRGMTLYVFDKDAKGATVSACTGGCLALWPVALAGSTMPTLTGVTGKVSTIPTPDGRKQLALDGRPLYHYVKDTTAGSTSGQGILGIWWVVDPTGGAIKNTSGGTRGGY